MDDPVHGRDNQKYTDFAIQLHEHGLLRVDDLTLFSPQEVVTMGGMSIGTAARIVEWAKADKIKLEGKARKAKKLHR
jgi:hypothetical protein